MGNVVEFELARQTLDMMVRRYNDGLRDAFSCQPECAKFAKAVIDSTEADGGPCPKLLGEDDGVRLTFMMEGHKTFYFICEDEVDVYAFNRAHFGDALNDPRELPSTTPPTRAGGDA